MISTTSPGSPIRRLMKLVVPSRGSLNTVTSQRCGASQGRPVLSGHLCTRMRSPISGLATWVIGRGGGEVVLVVAIFLKVYAPTRRGVPVNERLMSDRHNLQAVVRADCDPFDLPRTSCECNRAPAAYVRLDGASTAAGARS